MATPIMGFSVYVQYGLDAVWGTFPTITKQIPVYSYNVKSLGARIRPKLLTGSMAQPDLVNALDACQFELSMPMTYLDTSLLIDAIMGTSTYGSSGGATTGTLPYTHTWTGFGALMNSLSFELVDEPNGKCIRAIGCKVQKATFKVVAGLDTEDQFMRLDLVMIGYGLTENNAPTTSLVRAQFIPILMQHCTVQTDLGNTSTNANTLDWELVFDTMVKERPFFEGGPHIAEPQRSGRPQWTLTMKREYQNRNAINKFIANSGQLVETRFGIASNYVLNFSNFYGKQEVYPDRPVSDEGWITETLVLKGQGDFANGNAYTMDVALTNSQASITS